MRVAVVTPYYREAPDILRQCHESVRAQRHSCEHLLVADGHPSRDVATWKAQHFVLPQSHGDNGNTPRAIGSVSAVNQDFEAIAYLDADNWLRDDHIESLVGLHRRNGAVVCASGRSFHRLDGSPLPLREGGDGQDYVDTSCLFVTKRAFSLVALWALMPKRLSPMCDRVFWQGVRAGRYSHAGTGLPTVAFRTQYAFHYRRCGEEPPDGAKSDVFSDSVDYWNALSAAERRMYERRMGFGLRIRLGDG